jgi:hypothetical protein
VSCMHCRGIMWTTMSCMPLGRNWRSASSRMPKHRAAGAPALISASPEDICSVMVLSWSRVCWLHAMQR